MVLTLRGASLPFPLHRGKHRPARQGWSQTKAPDPRTGGSLLARSEGLEAADVGDAPDVGVAAVVAEVLAGVVGAQAVGAVEEVLGAGPVVPAVAMRGEVLRVRAGRAQAGVAVAAAGEHLEV